MLDFFRKNLKKLSILVWVATIAFIVGGAYLFVSGPFKMGSNVAIEVGKVKITFPEFNQTYNQMYNFYTTLLARAHGGNVSEKEIKALNIKQKAINYLIDRVLLFEEAKRYGIKVTDADLRKAIESNRAFFVNGHFSKREYLYVLKMNHMKPATYEAALKVDLYISKLKKMLFKNVKVTDKEVRTYYYRYFSKLDLSYVTFNPDKFKKHIKISTEALKTYYKTHKEQFRVPTMVKFEYVYIPFTYIEKHIKVTEKEAKKYYDSHISEFVLPEEIHIARILIKRKRGETDKRFKERVFKIYKRIDKDNFPRMAERYSDDPYTKNKGGDMGFVTAGAVPAQLWKHIRDTKPGEITKPFLTKFGYQIVLVKAIKKSHAISFKRVEGKIVKTIKLHKAKTFGFIEAKKIFVKLDSSKDWKKTLSSIGLSEKISKFMSITKPLPPFSKSMVEKGIISGIGKTLGPDEITGGYVIYRVTSIEKSYVPSFNKIRNRVEKVYINEKAETMAEKMAVKFSRMAEKEGFKKAAKMLKLKITTVRGIVRFFPDPRMPCTFNPDFMKTVFSKKVGFISECKANGEFYIYKIDSRKINEADLKKRREGIKEILVAQKEKEIIKRLLNRLKKETKIRVNPKL